VVVVLLVVDMVADPTETHPEVAVANLGGKLSFGGACPFDFGIDGQRRQGYRRTLLLLIRLFILAFFATLTNFQFSTFDILLVAP